MKTETIENRDAGFLSSTKFEAIAVFVEAGTAFVADGKIYGGLVYPANDATAEGIIYGNYDVSENDALVSLIVKGIINEERLAVPVASTAKAVLTGIVFEQNQY